MCDEREKNVAVLRIADSFSTAACGRLAVYFCGEARAVSIASGNLGEAWEAN